MPVTAPRRRFAPVLAAIIAVVVVGLAVRLGTQLAALGAAKADLGDGLRTATDLQAAAANGLGPPLLDAGTGKPADLLSQDLTRLGFRVRQLQMVAANPVGRQLTVARFAVSAAGDAAAVDRLALWVKANGRSAILEQLSATPDGDVGDVRFELDALVRQGGAAS